MKISWMEKSIDLAIARYNEIGIFLNLPTDNLYATANKQTVPFQLNFVSKTKKQEMVNMARHVIIIRYIFFHFDRKQ